MKKKIAFLLCLTLGLVLLQGISFAENPDEVFTDVRNPNAYYYDAVYWAYENGITTGTSPTTFSPNGACTRGQFVTFLWRAAGEPGHTVENPFTDVKAGTFYYDAVLWALEKGVTTGTSATTFAPNATCTRGQCVTFLWRAQGEPGHSVENQFADVQEGAFYYDAVLWAFEKGVTTGTSATTFSPNDKCLRGQIVTFLHRFAQLDDSVINPRNRTGMFDFFHDNSEILDIVEAAESPDVMTEGEAVTLLRGRGFDDTTVTYEYTIQGEYLDTTTAVEGSSAVRPMFSTYYMASSGDVWTIFVVNGEVFANPASFNLESELGAQLVFSESEHLTSYDGETNRFFVTLPFANAAIVKTVDRIDAATLDRLTIEEINRL